MLAQLRTLLKDEDIDHQSLLEIDLADGKTMFAFQTSGSKAVDYWHKLKALPADKSSMTPVILGTEQSFELLMEHLGQMQSGTTEELIAQAEKIDCQNWLAERLELFVCPPGEWPSAIKVGLVAEPDMLEALDQPLAINQWDENQHKMVLGERVYIGLFATTNAWEVPILLRFGGEANCPRPQEHGAMLKRWSEVFQAELMALEPNVIECFVEEPPMTKEQALKVAREHFGYCSERIEQGEGEMAPYAYDLLNTSLWTFWWD